MLCNGIKNIVSMKPVNFVSARFLKDEKGNKISDSERIANEFNNYFTNVANSITKKIPRTSKSPFYYLANSNVNSFFIFPCTSDEISPLIKSLKNGKSSGPNSQYLLIFKMPLILIAVICF